MKKETLETEIELLENKIKLKQKELYSINSNKKADETLNLNNESNSIILGELFPSSSSSGSDLFLLPNRLLNNTKYALDDSFNSNLNADKNNSRVSRHSSIQDLSKVQHKVNQIKSLLIFLF